LAVGAVLAYHLGFSRTPGGYIGVEVFFVLSGWLVCALLAAEHQSAGTIDLKAFWMRRARRLLPAAALVIGTTLSVAALSHYNRLGSLRWDAASAMAYVFNWRLIIDQQSYFEAAAGPSPLQHLWSLSIEEQFYLLLPLGLGAVLAIRKSPAAAAPVALAAAIGFTVWRMAMLTPGVDPSRVYYGTDTRAAGLLAGVALGLVWVPSRLRVVPGRWAAPVLDVVGLAALVVLGVYTATVTERDADAFGWSLTAVQIASPVLIAVVVHPTSGVLDRSLGIRPLRWVGQRSYGIYLWHWPIVVAFARAPGEQPESPLRSMAIVGATLLLAAASYRLVEQPIRRRGMRGTVRALRARVALEAGGRPAVLGTLTAFSVVGMVGAMFLGYDAALAPTTDQIDTEAVASVGGLSSNSKSAAAPSSELAAPAPAPADPAAAAAAVSAVPPAPAFPTTTGIGDSIMLGAAPALYARITPNLVVDAEVARQGIHAAEYVQQLVTDGLLGKVVILHLGANGPYPESVVDNIMQIVGPDREVILVNAYVPRRWEGEVNDTLADVSTHYKNIHLVDWNSVAAGDPGLLREDGFHLTAAGAERYADLLATTVLDAIKPPPRPDPYRR
jgi:peptidoglycan/LPS O-acetylase OafA/YrhL